ncbi:MAG: STAS domain-containing protein [Bacteroidales bacterium]|nr:STAS domain-containing protein [Bacteroidales bacterium]
MEIRTIKTDKALLVTIKERLDASWSEYFTDTFLEYIRNGEHRLVIDAQEMSFLSSAGIRSLLLVSKELTKVKGDFRIINSNEFVANTLRTTGFGVWLSEAKAEDILPATKEINEADNLKNLFIISKDSGITLKLISNWKPWENISESKIKRVEFLPDSFALGIAAPPAADKDAVLKFGDFVSLCGHIVYQPPEERSRPDYFLPMENFVPQLQTIQCIYAQGEMSHLLRFSPEENKENYRIGELASQALSITGSSLAAFVILAEADGLVGAHIIQSPEGEQSFTPTDFKKLRDWLSFSGERAYAGEQTLIFGVVAKHALGGKIDFLIPLSSNPEIAIHAHTTIFPYQTLQNGKLDLMHQITKFFNGPPPKGLMHLIDDNRPSTGLGESSFTRGAMWCAPAKWEEDNV